MEGLCYGNISDLRGTRTWMTLWPGRFKWNTCLIWGEIWWRVYLKRGQTVLFNTRRGCDVFYLDKRQYSEAKKMFDKSKCACLICCRVLTVLSRKEAGSFRIRSLERFSRHYCTCFCAPNRGPTHFQLIALSFPIYPLRKIHLNPKAKLRSWTRRKLSSADRTRSPVTVRATRLIGDAAHVESTS